jgi:hypothetical protein
MSGHTPGPWEITSISQRSGDIGIGQRDQRVLIAEVTNAVSFGEMVAEAINRGIEGSHVLRSDDATTQWANARLIAAAPDMLDALKAALVLIGHPDDAATKAIAAVIAKAEGRVLAETFEEIAP